ncbi:SLBB domain-containing protein [Aliiglaciecola sp. CAU 1673]|uniref:SLBB domain-containing protein n=1 Tax=Aliiglaciecola sp. CAU 1673 TaxID=3032595 RepID=UPI0023DB83EE|nr:SLBB domain-containing protein [Aliiglaciecola sp. CAU 1673]MDF2177500.1 SLBB domain-containing protein [Aliiglaciecola sp. CAU 1673]
MKSKLFIALIASLCLLAPITAPAQSFTPTDEQIQMFKKLSPSQQEALAKKYGLDMNMLGIQQTGNEPSRTNEQLMMLPRGEHLSEDEEQEVQEEDGKKGKKKEEEIKPFGYDIFAAQPTTFSPLSNAPVPLSYVIGPGDSLLVNIYGKENKQLEVKVSSEGKIELPGLAPVSVVGLTYKEVKELLTEEISNQLLGVKASISFGELRSIQVFIVGEVFTPGAYTVSSLATITHALFVSGGIKENGSLRKVQLKRAGKTIQTMDLYDFILKGDASNDALLQSGDVIFVPSVGRTVTVKGAVKRPAIYELIEGETYKDLLEMSGNAKASALLNSVSLHLYRNGVKKLVNMDFSSASQNDPIAMGLNEMVVPEVNDRFGNAVQVLGEVSQTGFFEWQQGLTVKSLIGSEVSFFTVHTDLYYALILREVNGGISVHQFNPYQVIQGTSDDIPLDVNDMVVFFSRYSNSDQLLSFKDLSAEEERDELIKERVGKTIEEKFFWDLYYSVTQPDIKVQLTPTDVPSIYELENVRLAELVDKYQIHRWNKTSRQYLLWPIYERILNKTFYSQRLPLIEVTGNVRFPGTYPLEIGLTLKEAFEAAGGLTDIAAEVVKISRVDENGGVEQFDVLVEDADEFVLSERDVVSIFPRPSTNEYLTVQIFGEVLYPGSYTFKRGTKLSKLIEQAGGLTSHALPQGAVFTRLDLKQKEKKNLLELADELRKQLAAKKLTQSVTETGTTSYAELQRVLQDLTDVEAIGRMVIDLPSILEGNEKADILMIRGDVLHIPPQSETVSVIGEVYLPTSHRYKSDMSLNDYLLASGGIKRLGDDENVYVIKANGSVERPESSSFWFASNSSRLSAGDTIVVPMDTAPIDNLTLWSTVTQILYQTGVAIAAIGSL